MFHHYELCMLISWVIKMPSNQHKSAVKLMKYYSGQLKQAETYVIYVVLKLKLIAGVTERSKKVAPLQSINPSHGTGLFLYFYTP